LLKKLFTFLFEKKETPPPASTQLTQDRTDSANRTRHSHTRRRNNMGRHQNPRGRGGNRNRDRAHTNTPRHFENRDNREQNTNREPREPRDNRETRPPRQDRHDHQPRDNRDMRQQSVVNDTNASLPIAAVTPMLPVVIENSPVHHSNHIPHESNGVETIHEANATTPGSGEPQENQTGQRRHRPHFKHRRNRHGRNPNRHANSPASADGAEKQRPLEGEDIYSKKSDET